MVWAFCSKVSANFCNASRTAASSAAYAVAVDLELATKATSPTKTIALAIAPPPPSMLLRFFIKASPVRRAKTGRLCGMKVSNVSGLANHVRQAGLFRGKIERDFEVANKNVVKCHAEGVNSPD